MTAPALPQVPGALARIDWQRGCLVGYSLPEPDTGDGAFDVVQLSIEGRAVASAVAHRSVFQLADGWAGGPLPAREQSAFELRIPQGSLLPSDLRLPHVRLALHHRSGQLLFEQTLQGPHELLRLTEGAPVDLLFEVQFRGFQAGAVQGLVLDRHHCGIRPALWARLNEAPPEPLMFTEREADAGRYHFQFPLLATQLVDGANQLHIQSEAGQPLAVFPIQMGSSAASSTLERRVEALEAQVEFFKQLILTQPRDPGAAKLALLKSEVVGLCSDMLALQRVNFEREALAAAQMAAAAGGEMGPA
jgi:hypothetical protein